MLKITFDSESVQDAFVCKLRDLGITNVNPSTVEVSVKTLRDGSGGAEAEVSFETGNSSMATAKDKEPSPDIINEPDTSTADADTDGEASSLFNN